MAGSDLLLTKITVDRAPDPILWIRTDGRIVHANEAACRAFGYAREDFLQGEITGSDPDSPGEALSRRLREQAGPGSRTFESGIRAADGTRIPVEVSASPILHGGAELDVCTLRDIRVR